MAASEEFSDWQEKEISNSKQKNLFEKHQTWLITWMSWQTFNFINEIYINSILDI